MNERWRSDGPRGRRHARARIVLAAVLTAGLLVGCRSSAPAADAGLAPQGASPTTAAANRVGGLMSGPPDGEVTDGGKIKFGIEAEPEGLNPTQYAFSQAGNTVASVVFDPLATIDENGRAVPYLATSIEHSDDFRTWTIGVPTGVTFHDGQPLTAEIVAQCLLAYQASPVISPSMITWFETAVATDATHVVVTTKLPFRIMTEALATQLGYVFSPKMLTDASLAKKPIGTGPFVFASHVDNQSWTFTKNRSYRLAGLPHLDEIEILPITDDGIRNSKLRNGDIDMLQTLGGPEVAELRTTSSIKLVENRNGDKQFLLLNTTKPPFDRVSARTAVAHATDSATWRKEVYADVALPANSPYGPGQLGYLEDNGFPAFDMTKAKALVAQYEQETGRKLEFEYLTADDVGNARNTQQLVPRFEEAGMKVTVIQQPQINLLAGVAVGSYQMSQFRLFSNPEPATDTFFYSYESIGAISLNFPRYANPEVDKLGKEAVGPVDAAKQDANFKQISRMMAKDLPFIWLGQMTWVVAANPKVNGLAGATNGTVPALTPKTWITSLSISR